MTLLVTLIHWPVHGEWPSDVEFFTLDGDTHKLITLLHDKYEVTHQTPPSDVGRQLATYVSTIKGEFTNDFLEAVKTVTVNAIEPEKCVKYPHETTIDLMGVRLL